MAPAIVDAILRPMATNVLYLIADDWSPLAGCYGSPLIKTPYTDLLAERGVVFTQAFCTSPSCAVSRANVLTGRYSHSHGQYGHCHGDHGFRTHERMRSLVACLRDAGYLTALIGKGHVAPDSVYPFERTPSLDHRDGARFRDHLREVIAAADAEGRPFYAHLGFADPHRGFTGPNAKDWPDNPAVRYDPHAVPVPDFLPDLPEVRQDLAEYYQCISRLDGSIGMALQALEDSGHRDDTLVICTSDHGMPFPGAKASPFDSGHHVPLIVAAPGMPRTGHRNRALVNHSDHMPTILDWCGIAGPVDLPGRSLLPILEQEAPTGWDRTFFSHNFHEVTNYQPYRVIRTQRFKYVRNLAWQLPRPFPSDLFDSPTWQAVRAGDVQRLGARPRSRTEHAEAEELYDLEADPAESSNLIDQAEHAAVIAELRDELTAFRQRTGDLWLMVDYQEGRLLEKPAF